MEEQQSNKYFSRRYLQTSIVILFAFGTSWFSKMDSTSLVALVLGALGVYSSSSYAEKKLESSQK
jgi:hypothetical protein